MYAEIYRRRAYGFDSLAATHGMMPPIFKGFYFAESVLGGIKIKKCNTAIFLEENYETKEKR